MNNYRRCDTLRKIVDGVCGSDLYGIRLVFSGDNYAHSDRYMGRYRGSLRGPTPARCKIVLDGSVFQPQPGSSNGIGRLIVGMDGWINSHGSTTRLYPVARVFQIDEKTDPSATAKTITELLKGGIEQMQYAAIAAARPDATSS